MQRLKFIVLYPELNEAYKLLSMKRKVNINRPQISSEEIAKTKDFTKLSNLATPTAIPFYKTVWFAPSIVGVSLLVAFAAFQYIKTNKEPIQLVAEKKEITKGKTSSVQIPSYDEDTPCINPPSEHLSMEATSFTVNSNEGGEFSHPSGTIIEIPKNAFEKDGISVQGDVEIKYKEFKDQVDILLSGIPMHYDSAGNEYVLESAGMVQIFGFQNNIPIQIKKGKAINISFNTEDKSNRFNLYELDTNFNNWKYKGKPEVKISKNERVNDYVLVEDNVGNQFYDSTSNFLLEKKQLKDALLLVKEDIAELKSKKPLEVKASKNKDRQFNLDIDKEEFPELNDFSEVVFEVLEEDENFSPKVYDIEWKNLILKEKIPGKVYFLNLYSNSKDLTLLVRPVLTESDQLKAEEIFENYSKKLSEKIENEILLQKRLDQAKLNYKLALKKQEEKREYEEKKFQHIAKQKKFKDAVVRTFKVLNFGTWNCDSPIRQPKGKSVEASFSSLAGVPLTLAVVYLIQNDKNAIFTFKDSQFGNLMFNPRETNTLVGFTLDDQIAIFRPEEFKKVNQKKFEFKMEIKKTVDCSIDKLKKIILAR